MILGITRVGVAEIEVVPGVGMMRGPGGPCSSITLRMARVMVRVCSGGILGSIIFVVLIKTQAVSNTISLAAQIESSSWVFPEV